MAHSIWLKEDEIRPAGLLAGQAEAFARDVDRLQTRRDEFVSVPCPACRANEAAWTLQKHSFDYLSCARCGTLYMNPRPSPKVMAAYYAESKNYRYWADHIFPASEAARREKLHRPRLQQIVEYCDRFGISPRTLVEIGPGFGTFCAVALESGVFQHVVGVEPTPEMAQACRDRGVQIIECSMEGSAHEIEPADVVVAFEVIEHVFDPHKFVRQCSRFVRPGGLLVLSCPNGQGFDVAVLGRESSAIDPEHVNLFNPGSLRRLVDEHGFKVMEVTTPGRLDAELVRKAAVAGRVDLSTNPFLKRVLIDDWDRLGGPFQGFLADHGLSSHMWLVARGGVGSGVR